MELAWILAFLNGAYLFAFGDPTLFYFLNILAHLVLGVVLIGLVGWSWRRTDWLFLSSFIVVAGIGITIVIIGGTRPFWLSWFIHPSAKGR
jgi:hypothetical protein